MLSKKDRAAQSVQRAHIEFKMALSSKRKYPTEQFRTFVRATRSYIDVTSGDTLIHRSVARAVSGLREYLQVERKSVPGEVLEEADRLEVLLFSGYDPYFEGDEPPGL